MIYQALAFTGIACTVLLAYVTHFLLAELRQERAKQAELRLSTIHHQLSTAPRRAVPVRMPALLDAEARIRALQSFRDDDPRWRVIGEILAEEIATAVDRTADKKMAEHPGSQSHAAGGLDRLLELRDRLEAERQKALLQNA